MPVRFPRLIATIAAILTLAAACGDDTADTETGTNAPTTTTTVAIDPTTNPASRTLTGDITIGGSFELSHIPESSRVVVRVEDISLQDVASVVLSERVYENVANLPLTYEAEWTPLDDSGPDISVSVSIYEGDELVFISDTVHPVADGAQTVDVEVISTVLDDAPAEGAEAVAAAVIGSSEEDAVAAIAAADLTSRVVERDGEAFAITMDFRTERVNLTILDGVVTYADVG